ncbi:MAG: aminotransferase class V-fold PLP-dependent enzyme [Flavobacteriales bacterium]|nr:aminotransferase class V-fold PLP-dependent enzyme [Flavobacteriales bacterium]
MAIDVTQARALTPGCAQVLHFNNAGSSLMPTPVVEAVKAHLDLEARIGGYEAAAEAMRKWEHAYDAIATLLNCSRDEVAITENASRSWDLAFHALPLKPGDRILTGHAEYVSNWLAFLLVKQRTGCSVELVPDDEQGQIDVHALRRMMDDRVKLVALTHVPSSNGLINPAEEVGAIVRGSEALYLLDACQSAGQMPLDVRAIGCDILSATGRKFLRGPRGTGFLYVRHAIMDRLEPVFIEHWSATWTGRDTFRWRDDARRFETWEKSFANVIGLAEAVDHALHWGLGAIAQRVQGLAASLRVGLDTLPGVATRDPGLRKSGIVTFTVDGQDAMAIMKRLAAQRINVTVGRKEIARLDLEERGLDKVVRASVHYFNTEREVERFVEAIAQELP